VASGNTMQGHEDRELWSPYRFLKALDDAGVDYDVIGLQIYYPSRDLFEIGRLIEQYATLGKPIHITELGTPSRYEDDPDSYFKQAGAVRNMGWWHAPWTPEIQADWIEQFYTICYSKPYLQAITWWDFTDHGGHFFPWGGFVDADLDPKPSYHRLRSLFTSWGHLPPPVGAASAATLPFRGADIPVRPSESGLPTLQSAPALPSAAAPGSPG
jgi:GH35 family endo-1,4-beta-xylanase